MGDGSMNSQYALDLAGLAGELLLKNGAEIFRTQETMHRILDYLGYPEHHIYVISNGIFATVNEGKEDRCSLVRHIPLGSVHLGYIDAVNETARELVSGQVTPEAALEQLYQLPNVIRRESSLLLTFASGVGAGAFCYMLGGSLLDAPFAFFLGCFLQICLSLLPERMPKFLATILGSLLVTLGSALFAQLSPAVHFDAVVIGSIIPLVPGVSFTTSIREFFNGDYLSGIIHLVDALLTGICIAAGVGFALGLIQTIGVIL
jgi:uncharacterized membrane protein YjjP (DUF1212 family)